MTITTLDSLIRCMSNLEKGSRLGLTFYIKMNLVGTMRGVVMARRE